jgi:hypothetical protein
LKNNLAIIIPAYKAVFLEKTLSAIESQTDKRFNLYIGNDAGDAEIETIVECFKDKFPINYVRFKDNLGSASLAQQWDRCLKMTGDEQWWWIMPDDDYPDPNCVSVFYENLGKSSFDVFRFNVQYVNEREEVFKVNENLPPVQSSFDSLVEKLSFKRSGSVAEYIFSKNKFIEIGGFGDIPLAWGTDDLLWFQIGFDKGIHGTNEAKVSLRHSEFNISANYTTTAAAKINANFIFFGKLLESKEYRQINNEVKSNSNFKKVAVNLVLMSLTGFQMQLSFFQMIMYSIRGNKIWGGGVLKNMRRFYLNKERIKNLK